MTRGSPSSGAATLTCATVESPLAHKKSYDITGSVKGAPSALCQ